MNRYVVTVALIMTLSLVLVTGIFHPAFAQTKSSGCSPGTCSSDSTDKSNTGSSNQAYIVNTSIKLIPDSGPPGTVFEVYGTGFYPHEGMSVHSPWDHPLGRVDSAGISIVEIHVAEDASPGKYTVIASVVGSFKEFGVLKGKDITKATFTVTSQNSNTVNSNIKHPTPPPPPPPPKPPQTPTTPTNTATGAGASSLSLTLNPTSGPAGTVVSLKGTGFFSGDLSLYMGNTKVSGSAASISGEGDGVVTGEITIPTSAQPGQITISLESPDATAIAFFTVTGKVASTTPTTPVLKGPLTPQQGHPGIKSSATTGKSTPSVILPKTTGKTTLPKTPSKPTSSITTGKTTGTITPKTPTVKSCPAGSFAVSGQCVSKGKVVATLK